MRPQSISGRRTQERRRKSISKRPGVQRDWRHAVEVDSENKEENTEKETQSETSEIKTTPREPPVDQTVYYEEKIAPVLDEISRAVTCGS